MFVVIAEIQLKEDIEPEFKQWFEEANQTLSKLEGFVSRRLLKSSDGIYRIVVEHQSKETFEKMHQSQEHEKLHAKAITFMARPPSPSFYNVIAS
jgi:heme-degrading monooxygenase HmoA